MKTFRTRGALGMTVVQAVVGWAVLVGSTVGAPTPADAKTKFYLTKGDFQSNAALTACAPGYHMASLWEILELGNLRYDTSRGFVTPDSGSGPPSAQPGWVRTGYYPYSSDVPGGANCGVWTSTSGGDYGTGVFLEPGWRPDGASSPIRPWYAGVYSCEFRRQVWCVQK